MQNNYQRCFLCLLIFAVLAITQNGYCAWMISKDTELIILERTDEILHEIDDGKYRFYDEITQGWVTVLDFSISSDPLVPIDGTLKWLPDPKMDK